MRSEGSLTLDRGLAVLQVVADAGGEPVTVTELADAVEVSRPAIYRLLVPLTDRGLVSREGSRVRLGVGLLRLSERVLPQLRSAARPVLRDLAEDTGATAHLSVAEGELAHAVAVAEPSTSDFHVSYRVGSRHPLDRGAAGKAMAPRRGAGWVSTADEIQPGARGVAAPVRGIPGLRACVGVVSLDPLDPEQVGPRVVAAASTLAGCLGQARAT